MFVINVYLNIPKIFHTATLVSFQIKPLKFE